MDHNDYVMSHNNNSFVEAKKSKKSKSNSKNKKRFTDEQIKSLESIFESETKLEPRKKVQLARELGLQPRQIAIWFQNRRARWKSKQIEQEYKVLKASYDHLASQFEFLVKEKQSLMMQLQRLSEMLEKRPESERNKKNLEGNCIGGEAKPSCKTKAIVASEGLEKRGLSSQEHMIRSKNINVVGEDVLNTDCSLGSLEKLCNFESSSGGLIDQPSGNLHWWNIWT